MTREQQRLLFDRLGPDPLRADADWTRAWDRVGRSRAPIGGLLMDQSVLAGVGNVYRAEVLFRHRVDPLRPGSTLRRGHVRADVARPGGADGRRRPARPDRHRARPGQEARSSGGCRSADTDGSPVYVYRRAGEPCFVCGSRVRTQELVGRNLFWCPRCQPRFRSRAPMGRACGSPREPSGRAANRRARIAVDH